MFLYLIFVSFRSYSPWQVFKAVGYCNAGIDWHPNLRSGQNLITQEDLPRFVMDSYEDCRGPPRLFLLDKYGDLIVKLNVLKLIFM